jgi:hypothetical protein
MLIQQPLVSVSQRTLPEGVSTGSIHHQQRNVLTRHATRYEAHRVTAACCVCYVCCVL